MLCTVPVQSSVYTCTGNDCTAVQWRTGTNVSKQTSVLRSWTLGMELCYMHRWPSDTHYVDCNLPYKANCQYCEQYLVISTFMFQWPSQSFLLVEIIQQWVCNMFILTLSTTNLKIKNWSSLFFIRVCLITTDCVWNKRVFAGNSDSVKKLLWKAEISDVIRSSLN